MSQGRQDEHPLFPCLNCYMQVYVLGRTQREAAEELGISLATVSRRLALFRKHFVKWFDEANVSRLGKDNPLPRQRLRYFDMR